MMKKTLTITVTMLSFATLVQAQNFGLGVRVGANFSQLPGPDYTGFKQEFKPGIQAGLLAHVGIKKFSIQPEVLFYQTGTILKAPIMGKEYTFVSNINYINIPVFLKYSIGLGPLHIGLGVGPYIGIALGGQSFSDFPGATVTTIKVEKNGLAAQEFGVTAQPGIALKLGPGRFIFDVRVSYGLTDVYNVDPKPANYKPAYNFVIGASLGYHFVFGL